MNTVNYWLICSALGPLEEARIKNGRVVDNPDDADDLRSIFAEQVVPEVSRWTATWQDKLKLSLAYYLEKPDVLTSQVLGNLQDLEMPEPLDVKAFFRVLWEVLFPGQLPNLTGLKQVVENNDVMQLNEIVKHR